MTNDNLHATVRLPASRWGTIIKAHEPQEGSPPIYDVEADGGEIIAMVEIAEGSLIPREDYERLIATARGIKDGTIGTIDIADWMEDLVRDVSPINELDHAAENS